jgi:hypothetical protein
VGTFERENVLRMFGGIKANGNWRKRYNKELIQLFGNLDILSFVRISQLNWIGHVKIMDSERKLSEVFKIIIPREVD